MSEKFSTDSSTALSLERQEEISKALAIIRSKVQAATQKSSYSQTPRVLLATKTRSPEEINFAIHNGFNLIGENRVQELCNKYDLIDKTNTEIHFIGALQTNKVKYIIDKVSMIHSVDRLSLALEIDRQAKKRGIIMNVLCEINIADEKSKSGLPYHQTIEFLEQIKNLHNIRVCGLMSIPPVLTEKSIQIEYFRKIMNLYIDISKKKIDNINMSVLSFGMSDDYDIAIECGSNLVRIGTAAFGYRNK